MSKPVYVSITGLQLKKPWYLFVFIYHAVKIRSQIQNSPGNLKVETRKINGVYHTLSAWDSADSMRNFSFSGAHQQAIDIFPKYFTGKTCGFLTDQIPDWPEIPAIWAEKGVPY